MKKRTQWVFQGVKINSGGTEFYLWITKHPNPRTRQFEPYTQSKKDFWASAGLRVS